MQRFNRTSVDEKAKIIPTKLLEEIQLEETASIFSDQHLLKKDKDNEFVCAKINGLSECMSGIDHEDKSIGKPCYICYECDLERCEKCVKLDIFISRYDR